MAGKGIEYSWGIGKNSYRRLAIANKKTKEKFRESVKMCLQKEYVTRNRVRMFSRRARQYIIAYYLLAIKEDAVFSDEEEITKINGVMGSKNKATPINIKKLTTLQKNHWCTLDFNNGFMCQMIDGVDTTFVQ
jgi:hypothetical protein